MDEQYIISAIKVIRNQQQRPDKSSISSFLNRKHGLSISAVTQTIDRMLDSAAIYCKPRNGKDSYYIFDPLDLCENEDEDIDSVTECTQMLVPHDNNTSTTGNESGPHQSVSPELQTSEKHSCESLDTTLGFLDVMGKLADTVNDLNKQLCTERERNEKLTSKLNMNKEEILKLQHRIQVLEAESRNNSTKRTIMDNKENDDLVTAQTKLTFSSQWNSYVKAKSQQYEQYLISKKFEELKSTTPRGTNRREEEINKNNTANSKTRHLDITKPRQRTSNIHIRKAGHKNTKTTSSDRLSNSNGKGMKETSGEVGQNRRVYIIGDSMIKGIKHWKMQSKDTKVVVRSFAGAKTRQMMHYAKPAEEDNPSLYILHIGTNDLKENKSAVEIADEITSLARSLKKDNNEVKVSGICPRGDNLNDKASGVNKILEQRCKHYQLGFINHKQMDAKYHTNGSNLHLNRAGDSILAKSFLCEIRM